MTGQDFVTAIVFGIGLVLCIVFSISDDPTIRYACGLGGGLLLAWWAFKGQRVKGWIGPSYRDLLAEEQRLDAMAANWEHPDGTVVSSKEERLAILKSRDKIYRQLHAHPENPKRGV